MSKIFKSYKRGMGIKVRIIGDNDTSGKQKIRPAIIIKSYPSHIKVQLLSTQPNKNDYYSIKVNNIQSYIRSIYYKTITIDEIHGFWHESGKQVILDPKSKFFEKVAEMEYKEIAGQSINRERQKYIKPLPNEKEKEEYLEYEN